MTIPHRVLAALSSLVALSFPLTAQTAPAFKGIWEPVSFSEDLDLASVFFVTATMGWASGKGGTILFTRDGGASWTAQLGGDPASTDQPVSRLHFLDERHGWAIQDKRFLRTSDGENWEPLGELAHRPHEFAFVSPERGVVAMGVANQSGPDHIQLTTDGGKTWKPVAPCAVKVMLDGLNRTLRCTIDRFHFPSASVGYAVAHVQCVGSGCGGPPILAKTTDGGESWQFLMGPGDLKLTRLDDVFFTDENNGVVAEHWGKLHVTSDGGQTWRATVATAGEWTRFADPEVGWSFGEQTLSYSSDGGKRWLSRPHRFPAHPRGLSFPRRDRAYVVGDHGMVFRYSVVPAAAPAKSGSLRAPAMPAFASSLDDEVARSDSLVSALAAALEQPVSSGGGTRADSSLSSFTAACCGQPVNRLGLILGAIGQSLPAFLSRYKNTNLLGAGLRMLNELPGRFGELKGAATAFKQAPDKAAAQAALEQLKGAAQALHQSTRAAFQQEVP